MADNRTYADAVSALNSLQSSFAVLEERRRLGIKIDESAVREMKEWVSRAGHTVPELDRLNIVHVAGTKGKGTTCAFVDSILGYHRSSCGVPNKIGLFTSPHLLYVRERIKINSEPISEEAFTRYFFEVWDALEDSAAREGRDPQHKPTYFRFLTLLCFHVFIREQVDIAIFETGVGGEWDSTNIIEIPAVTGITTLGIDHVIQLGDTIDKIAWHKSGIFKSKSPAFTVEQVPLASEVLQRRAAEKGVILSTVGIHDSMSRVRILPDADFQRQNASLAIALVNSVLERLGQKPVTSNAGLSTLVKDALENTKCRGRCERLFDGNKTWYLDGAHTKDSLEVGGTWFVKQAEQKTLPRVLIFNNQSRPEALTLLEGLHQSVQSLKFDLVIFCTNVTRKTTGYRKDFVNRNSDPSSVANLTLQKRFADMWERLEPSADVQTAPTIQEAVDLVGDFSDKVGEVQIFVTGSSHLVGGTISILEGILTPVTESSGVTRPARPER